MEFLEIRSPAKIQLQSYQDKTLKINGEIYSQSLIALPEQLITDWAVQSIQELTPVNCEIFKSLNPEVLLIGTGTNLVFPKPEILAWFRGQKLGVEFMDTAAACRTFQVLTSENRKVVAGLIV